RARRVNQHARGGLLRNQAPGDLESLDPRPDDADQRPRPAAAPPAARATAARAAPASGAGLAAGDVLLGRAALGQFVPRATDAAPGRSRRPAGARPRRESAAGGETSRAPDRLGPV